MPSWFICPYKRTVGTHLPGRYCAMDDFTAQIVADGADPQRPWVGEECLGNCAVVKVSSAATAATLQAINAAPGFVRVPVWRLDDPLSSLTNAQKNGVRNKVLALGYTAAEVQAALGSDLSSITLGQLLRFILGRRLKPRYDVGADAVNLDGAQETPQPPEAVDVQVA